MQTRSKQNCLFRISELPREVSRLVQHEEVGENFRQPQDQPHLLRRPVSAGSGQWKKPRGNDPSSALQFLPILETARCARALFSRREGTGAAPISGCGTIERGAPQFAPRAAWRACHHRTRTEPLLGPQAPVTCLTRTYKRTRNLERARDPTPFVDLSIAVLIGIAASSMRRGDARFVRRPVFRGQRTYRAHTNAAANSEPV